MNIKKLNEELAQYLQDDKQDLKIGDKVVRRWDKSYNKREGIITKKIDADVFEVNYPETASLIARTDRHYAQHLIKVN